MIGAGVLVVVLAWAVQAGDHRAWLEVPAICWLLLAAAVGWFGGWRAGLVLLLAGWVLVRAQATLADRLTEGQAGPDRLVSGIVCDFPRPDSEALRFFLETDAGTRAAGLPARLHLSWYDDAPKLQPGDRWQLLVRLKPPHGLKNPGGFDFERWLYVKAAGASGYVRADSRNRPLRAAPADCLVGRARGWLTGRIEAAVGEYPGIALVLGVAVGATHRITEAEWELLRATGTTHLLAISGLNIAMAVAPLLLLLSALQRLVPERVGWRRVLTGVTAAVAAGYSALSGFEVSTVRALAMLVVALVVLGRGRRLVVPDLLGLTAMLTVAWEPATVVAPGFWLSFVGVAWLLVVSGSVQGPARGPGVWPWLAQQLRLLLRAQLVLGLGLAPLSLAFFGQVSVIAPVTNFVAVPVFSLLAMPLTLLGTALAAFDPAWGAALLRAAADVLVGLFAGLRLAAGWWPPLWLPPWPGAAGLVLAGLATLLVLWWRPFPGRWLAPLLLLPLLFGAAPSRPPLSVTVLDVGQGLAVLVATARHVLVYDTGPAFRERDAGESVLVPALHRAGWRALDAVVVSHADGDHRGGLESLLAALPARRLLAPTALGPGLAVQPCRAGQRWRWDGVDFEFLSPLRAGDWRSDNDSSCVLRVTARGRTVLLTGDIERRREEWLVRRARIPRADLVVAPHHGSRSSSSPLLVAATRPRWVVFATGYRNRWRFPAAEVQARWRGVDACLLDTAATGALRFTLDRIGRFDLAAAARSDDAQLWTAQGPPQACPDGPTP